ncbi:Beta sliding clamp [Buchnera aphidicola (Cinara splendens)]|uniref:Beta sliding clamp n=1 Tax=Buchnera aphidicola (Cinara splendens) TaxID=2518979 RepID=A0A451DDS5_9GAMM|nr:DNA polymerase III subunit beta [Buchnera aphidicola]VFP84777.1 Beta sliding clamp [Buchnera aphidicola (Cinara splendens)]
MEFKIKNNDFLNSFKKINRIITKNAVFPILENVIIKINENILQLTSSTLEIELHTYIRKKYFIFYTSGCVTISGKKIFSICRNIKRNEELHFHLINKKMHIKIFNSLFKLNTLSQKKFPKFKKIQKTKKFFISQTILKKIISSIYFSIAHNDVRNSLNGMLIEYKKSYLYTVTTDGHRLSMYTVMLNAEISSFSIIVNKQAVLELNRLLTYVNDLISMTIDSNYVSFQFDTNLLITKLLNGNFPNYHDVILKKHTHSILLHTEQLKESLLKTSILCNTTFKGVFLNFSENLLKITSNNQDDEESCDSFYIKYQQKNVSFSINVFYLLDVLNALNTPTINIIFDTPISSIQIQSDTQKETKYIIMPLKL